MCIHLQYSFPTWCEFYPQILVSTYFFYIHIHVVLIWSSSFLVWIFYWFLLMYLQNIRLTINFKILNILKLSLKYQKSVCLMLNRGQQEKTQQRNQTQFFLFQVSFIFLIIQFGIYC